MDRHPLRGEVALILGHHIALGLARRMQITRPEEGLKPKCGKLLEREVEKPGIIGFEGKDTTRLHKLDVGRKKGAVRKAPLGVPCLWPGIAEVQIDPRKRRGGEPRGKIARIPTDKAQVSSSRTPASFV